VNNPFLKHKRPAEEKSEKPKPHPVTLAAWEAVRAAAAKAGVVQDGSYRHPTWSMPSRENVPALPTREFFLRLAEHIKRISGLLATRSTPAALEALQDCEEPMQDYTKELKKLKAMERLGMRTK